MTITLDPAETSTTVFDPAQMVVNPLVLSDPTRYMLWRVAQHVYGWTHVSRRRGQVQVADALVRRGLVRWDGDEDGSPRETVSVTNAGLVEIARCWPVSPLVLGTYDWRTVQATHGEWTPVEGASTTTAPVDGEQVSDHLVPRPSSPSIRAPRVTGAGHA